MTSVSGNTSIQYRQFSRTASTTSSHNAESNAAAAESAGDSVEISAEARALLEQEGVSSSYQPFTYMEPEEFLVPGSDKEKEFKELLKSVTTKKSDVMSQIEGILEKKGLSLNGLGKMKIEVTDDGKIVVGGLRDAKTAKAVEKALNEDKSLAKNIKDFQADEKELSEQIKKYTGCDLYQLTMTARGDINQDIRDTVVAQMPDCPPRDDWYWRLGFLGETTNVVNVDEVTALGFNGMIDFSGELTTMAEPERNIKKSMKGLRQQIQEEFDALNNEAIERAEALGIEMDDDWKARNLLDVDKVKITVDNLGGVTVEGLLADSEGVHDKGEEVIRRLASHMLNDYDENSYHRPAFTDASSHLLDSLAEETGREEGLGWDAKVTAELAFGHVGDIAVSSPRAEKELAGEVENSVKAILENAGVELPEGVKIEVDDSGKIIAANLPQNGPDTDRILSLLDKINADLKNVEPRNADSPEEEEKAEDKLKADPDKQALRDIADALGKLKTLRGRA